MQKVAVRLGARPEQAYTIYIGGGILNEVAGLYDFAQYSKLFVVTDDVVAPLLLDKFVSALPGEPASIVLPSGDGHKDIETTQTVWSAMRKAGCDRKSLVINLGGGVITDLGGFAASTYMRGVDFLNIPTTLLAQVDASVGGKTGFNFAGVKNLIGTFAQPVAVIIDTEISASLPKRELISGFAEIIKHGLIADKKYFQTVTAKPPADFTPRELETIIARSCEIKRDIVQSDTKETGRRKLLNFGHTVGHAMEALSLETASPLSHGEAVAVGMSAEIHLSRSLDYLSDSQVDIIDKAINKCGLPISLAGLELNAILSKMKADKKNEGGKINFTLLKGIGDAEFNIQASDKLIAAAVQSVLVPGRMGEPIE